jgi:L,D-transpeptidase ErfK/SrfK
MLLMAARARAQDLPPISNRVVGGEFTYVIKRGDFLGLVAARYAVDPSVIAATNGIKLSTIIHPGQRLRIDNRHVVPNELENSILINVPQRMLHFFRGLKAIHHFPVALGRPDWPTPTGSFKVTDLRKHPVWTVPKSIQREMAMEGEPVRTKVPPGPDNPLGEYWIGLSICNYGIHATNAPSSIYTFQTHGCIRLHTDDAAVLFNEVAIGTPGKIIYEPVLMARLGDGRIFLEVDRDVYRRKGHPAEAVRQLAALNDLSKLIDWGKAEAVIRAREGIARDITAASTPKE